MTGARRLAVSSVLEEDSQTGQRGGRAGRIGIGSVQLDRPVVGRFRRVEVVLQMSVSPGMRKRLDQNPGRHVGVFRQGKEEACIHSGVVNLPLRLKKRMESIAQAKAVLNLAKLD